MSAVWFIFTIQFSNGLIGYVKYKMKSYMLLSITAIYVVYMFLWSINVILCVINIYYYWLMINNLKDAKTKYFKSF